MTDATPGRLGGQDDFTVRFEWGPVGAGAVAAPGELAVVVDVLSFTTTLSVAADRGIAVVPCPWRDDRAAALARDHDAVLAVRRADAGPGDVSLSPASLRAAGPLARLVLPSPNGSTISSGLAERGVGVVGASLRNRRAVARWLARSGVERVAVIAAGERWPDGSLRPAIEDLWGAGAVVDALADAGWTGSSPEARTAAAAFRAVADDVRGALHGCSSGAELRGIGHADDVDVAAELDDGVAVPVLRDGRFLPDQPPA